VVAKVWSGSTLTVPSRVSQRLPHLTAHDVAEIDAEVREALTEIGEDRLGYAPSLRREPH
jgi:phage terminase Nu1 subunit (DNA packaging protein)